MGFPSYFKVLKEILVNIYIIGMVSYNEQYIGLGKISLKQLLHIVLI